MARQVCLAKTDWVEGTHGFRRVICARPATATFISQTGLRVGYCDELGHENAVRHIYTERVDADLIVGTDDNWTAA